MKQTANLQEQSTAVKKISQYTGDTFNLIQRDGPKVNALTQTRAAAQEQAARAAEREAAATERTLEALSAISDIGR